MTHFEDNALSGHALIFDGPLDLISKARKANEGPTPFHKIAPVDWPGRYGKTWEDLENFVKRPWPQGVKMVKTISDAIKKDKDMPQPIDMRRKPRWSEVEGDVDVDRAMHGDPEYMRVVKRAKSVGPTQIAIVSNLDLSKGSWCNDSGIWFRSACTIALADVLEELGYSVEIWTWCRGVYVYPAPNHAQFIACRPKRFGEPVDIDALCDTMSAWFTTEAVFGAIAACPVAPVSLGATVEPPFNELDVTKIGMGKWIKYLDLQGGTIPVCVPMIQGSSGLDGSGVRQAVQVARDILTKIVEAQN